MASSLGKRKERDDEPPKDHGSTLFVSNLPYTATSVDLQTLFSDIGPVKSAFVVTEQGTGISKGVGYVSFAMKEDAEGAFEGVKKGELVLAGRVLRVDWAGKKPKTKSEPTEKKESKPRPQPHRPHAPHDPLAIRTIVVSGLPTGVDSKVLWKKFRKYQGAEKVDWPAKIHDEEEDTSIAHVVFSKPAQAQDAVTKLHAHVFKGSLLSVTLKKRLDNLSKPSKPPPTTTTASPSKPSTLRGKAAAAAPSHASRLIVRNIPFNATEQDLRAVFLPYGPIYSIHIPLDTKPKTEESNNDDDNPSSSTSSSKPQQPRTKGFAFVWMLSKKDAEKAIEGCNGMVLRAGTAEALVEDKQKRKKQKRLEKKMKAAASGSRGDKEAGEGEVEEGEEPEEGDEEKEETSRATERVIAVDWALSKDKWEKEKAKMDEAADVKQEDGDDDKSESESGDDDDENLGVHSGSGSDDDDENTSIDDDDDYSDRDEEPVKPQLPPPATGTTLFVRNIPYEATEDELRTLFRPFGPLRYARITIDPATGRSRGTGFACFWNLEDADKVIEQSERLRAETSTGTRASSQPKKNPFSMPSILTMDPSASLAQSLVLHGRTLDVVRAVTRDEAGRLKESNERAREKADKRNIYLLREGIILPNTPAAATLTPADIERRTASFNARRTLLKTNPSLFISKTRLSVRQIPVWVSERMLKKLAVYAVRAFEKEVKAGTREGLTRDELAVDAEDAIANETTDNKDDEDDEAMDVDTPPKPKKKFKQNFRKPSSSPSPVLQAKIVRQTDRIDPLSGKGKSKGYGFLQMSNHADALRFLRWANNGPEVHALFEEWRKGDLEVMLKAEMGKTKEGLKDEARIERVKKEIEACEEAEKGEGRKTMKAKGGLIVEFSIENVQVVQRRKAALERSKEDKDKGDEPSTSKQRAPALRQPRADRKRGDRPNLKPKDADDDSRPKKKQRKADASTNEKEPKENSTSSSPTKPKTDPKIASLIGRKRKERKTGKRKPGK